MLKLRILPFLIGYMICTLALASDENLERTKRQAPSINVHQIPKTSFSCAERKVGEYYADPETNCQVYHVCIPGMHNKMSLMSFVCPNGTIFSQATRVCTPWERVDCRLTLKFYDNLHGSANDKRTDYEAELDNYVPQPQPAPREPAQPPRQSSRGRTTSAPPPPPPPPARDINVQPPRNTRFRSGGNQFRGQQAPPTTTVAPARTTTSAPALPVRVAVRPAPQAFRPPALGGRPSQIGAAANVLPPRPTPRTVVSTSTSSYNYEYEYEYDYEDETPAADQVNARSKREANAEDYESEAFEGKSRKTSFTCEDKVAGGVYADVESDCEMFHICVPMGKYKMLDYKVFCANGTGFDQETGSCREKEEFNCENAFLFYQFQKPHQPTSSKKPILSKKMYAKSKKAIRVGKE